MIRLQQPGKAGAARPFPAGRSAPLAVSAGAGERYQLLSIAGHFWLL